jgi:DNA-binding NarL/FixJ family response regulator
MSRGEIRILLVDDHQMMRAGLRRVLAEQPDFEIAGEMTGNSDVAEVVEETQPHVIIMDVHMPEKNGIEIAAAILSPNPGIKIIMLSADAELPTVRNALQTGVSGYVTKNSPPSEIVQAIRAAMDNRVHLCPEVAAVVVQDYMNVVIEGKPDKPSLSGRERTLLKMVAQGKRNKEIALAMQIGVKSVETYRSRLMRKLGCSSPAELTRYAIKEGLISL